jgi:hypothetical protein
MTTATTHLIGAVLRADDAPLYDYQPRSFDRYNNQSQKAAT